MPEATSTACWWAGIVTVLPRASAIPPAEGRWAYRWNELRWLLDRPPVFPWPSIGREEARRLAAPACTGLGDLLCAWMMPMALGDLMGWSVRIPVPARAGGIHHDPGRPALTPEWFHARFAIPPHVELVAAEAAPEGADWFCAIEPQWYLNSCMETSYHTIPSWLRSRGLEQAEYYRRYRRVARGLLPARSVAPLSEGAPYLALHARRRDRGEPQDEQALHRILESLSERFRQWVVVSDDRVARERLSESLAALGGTVLPVPGPAAIDSGDDLMADFRALVGAAGVVSSVKHGWSAFPYAATRISGAPLLIASRPAEARVWRLFRAYSAAPLQGVWVGPSGAEPFRAEASADAR